MIAYFKTALISLNEVSQEHNDPDIKAQKTTLVVFIMEMIQFLLPLYFMALGLLGKWRF